MKQRMRRLLMVLPGVACFAAALWLLFGWSDQKVQILVDFEEATIRYQRSWGRIVQIRVDRNGDGRCDSELRYSWREPFVEHEEGHSGRHDTNFDGRWDVWEERGDAWPVRRFSVDTDFDGESDLEITAPGLVAWTRIREVRSNKGAAADVAQGSAINLASVWQ